MLLIQWHVLEEWRLSLELLLTMINKVPKRRRKPKSGLDGGSSPRRGSDLVFPRSSVEMTTREKKDVKKYGSPSSHIFAELFDNIKGNRRGSAPCTRGLMAM